MSFVCTKSPRPIRGIGAGRQRLHSSGQETHDRAKGRDPLTVKRRLMAATLALVTTGGLLGQGHTAAATTTTAAATTHRWNAPMLGASLADWMHAYGRYMPNTSATIAGWRPCGNHTTAQLMVMFEAGRAISVIGQPCGDRIDPRERSALASRYMPHDAMAHGCFTTDQGQFQRFVSWTGSHDRCLFWGAHLPHGLYVGCKKRDKLTPMRREWSTGPSSL